uniref:Uncharacterized protein n=1 Tax=Ciona intestinalis TaxID=7719 RepID=H2XNS4_CIOIN
MYNTCFFFCCAKIKLFKVAFSQTFIAYFRVVLKFQSRKRGNDTES